MDPKMIEMNNLRVLNDYLNQTLEVLTRTPRASHSSPMGYSPFTPYASPTPGGTDVVWGQGPWTQQGPWMQSPWGQSPYAFGGQAFGGQPFGGQPLGGAPAYGSPFTPNASPWGAYPQSTPAYDPFYAQRAFTQGYGAFGWQPPMYGYGQSFSPIAEVQRQAQVNQALAAKHSVLEAICRACGVPV